MRAVKAAEKRLWETETTKTYTALAGEPAYHAAMAEMILGHGYPADAGGGAGYGGRHRGGAAGAGADPHGRARCHGLGF